MIEKEKTFGFAKYHFLKRFLQAKSKKNHSARIDI